MLPFERLRYLARYTGDDRALVDEAADCLADFDDDPAQLVLVCRRLLAHHPANGPLWWLCARVVGASDPAAAAVDAMRAALKKANKPSEIVTYPDTPHAFNADYRPSYRKQQAEDGWAKALDWFKKNGVA